MAHWYILVDGRPQRYVQYNADGSERKFVNRKKALEDGAVLGLTDTLSYLGKGDALREWYANLAIECAISNCGIQDPVEFEAKTRQLFEDRATAPASVGTDIHEYISSYLTTGVLPEDEVGRRACDGARKFIDGLGVESYTSEKCLIYIGREKYFRFGGTTDFVSANFIVDFKTVSAKNGKYRKPTWKECAQLAGYRMAAAQMGLADPSAACFNVYFDRETGDVVNVKGWRSDQLQWGAAVVELACRVVDMLEGFKDNGDNGK